ncbi:hypothetical protein [Planctomyces sp. SH-PL14]|uniref:hypothetical protein n=1 Tax=Planctomyces sp. SH-PL14 TaxID=1632864 RepID=UPI00078BE141|nr:hypothetical protein [Planctomyces sp. SH-PL14]AMV19183.1 hypothetical protein VT03_14935 [Planctomyces sp. SH-PL14]
MRYAQVICSSALSALILVGCGRGGGELSGTREPTFPASGVVTYKGEPVPDATVGARSTGTKNIVASSGRTDSSGRFSLSTYQPGDGAIAGQHQFTVTKAVTEGDDPSYFDPSSPNYGKPAPKTTTKYLVPQKYSSFDTSGLSGEVKDSGSAEIKLELKD